MRTRGILCASLAVVLVGCGGDAQPDARRSDSAAPTEKSARDATGVAAVSSHPDLSRPTATSDAPAVTDEDGELRLDKLTFSIPEGWNRRVASSGFIMAEIALPRVDPDSEDGRLTVSSAGGSMDMNIERWRDQFGGKPDPASEERKQVDGMDVRVIDFFGEFTDQRGPFPANKRGAFRMLAAIYPVDGQLYFVKAVGPKATIAAHAERILAFVDSAKKK